MEVGGRGVGGSVGGVVGGDVAAVSGLEVEFDVKAFGGEEGFLPVGGGGFVGVEGVGEGRGVGKGVGEEVGGRLDEDVVPGVEIGAEGGVEGVEGAVFFAEVAAEGAQGRGEGARLRGPVVAEGDGGGREGGVLEEAVVGGEPFGVGRGAGRGKGNGVEGGVVGAEGDVQGVEGFVEESFEVLLPEGFVGDQEAGNQAVLVEVGDGLGGAGEHEAEGVEHGDGAREEKRIEERHQKAGAEAFAADFGKEGHGAEWVAIKTGPSGMDKKRV